MEQRTSSNWPPQRRRRRKRNLLPLYALNLAALILAGVSIGHKLAGQDPKGIIPTAQASTMAGDELAPEILGAKDLTVEFGEAVSYYQDVTARDDLDPAPELTIDSSQVDLSRPGKYFAVYTARDAAGNVATQTITVTVIKPEYYVEQETIFAAVDTVLDEIITEDMDKRQQVEAIYRWCKDTLHYGGHTLRADYIQAAYEMLTTGKGDCYGYFALSKLMMERLGIPNIDVEKIKHSAEDPEHFWSLVSVDGKTTWYHFDATPRVGQTEELCLVTDLFLDSFDTFHEGCHERDKSLYPATPEGWS